MDIKLVKVDSDENGAEYKLKNGDNVNIVSYSVEYNKENILKSALISYETKLEYRHQGYASLGLNMLKNEIFSGNHILLLELIHLSGDYSRKVAENAGFFPASGNLNYFVALHPFAEAIVTQQMSNVEKESSEYKKNERLLEKIKYRRISENVAMENLRNKLESLRQEHSYAIADQEMEYVKTLDVEISHIEKILNNLSLTEDNKKSK